MTDRDSLAARAGAVAGIYQTIATVVIIVGVLAMVAGFIQALLENDDVVVGILAGLLVALAILVYVVVAWAGVQMFALVSGYIHQKMKGDLN